ncbi:MAG: putative signal transduction protein [Ilumatobacteraceae bacterium]|nr:putative signal transduction protein [Ilumatobacteraceae bacterium]
MAYVFCNKCGHRNPPESMFCSACGTALDLSADHTISLAKVDPLLDAPGPADDVQLDLAHLPGEGGVLIVRSGAQAGETFVLSDPLTRLGRHPDSEIILDDITVSRRHAEVERSATGYVARDAGSLNGTYVNQERVDETPLRQGDELQVGKFRLVFFERVQ